MSYIRRVYLIILGKLFWYTAKKFFPICIGYIPTDEEATYMKPSVHLYHRASDMIGYARIVVEAEEERCRNQSIQNSPTSSER